MLITPEYRDLQSQFHEAKPHYGTSSNKHVDSIASLAKALGTRDILDYGCGKAMLQKGLPFPIQNYDPAILEYCRPPTPAALVICTDVLEHIEPSCLKDVLDDLARLTLTALYVNVSCKPAKKELPDGRNAHLIIESPNWWMTWLLPRFQLQSFQASQGDFTAIFMPLSAAHHKQPPPASASTGPAPSPTPLPGSLSA